MKALNIIIALALFVSLPVIAGKAVPVGDDQLIEARLRILGENLRCLVCQNESIVSSNAKLAVDLRREIREQMINGKNDTQIIEYLTLRYGDFILYKPPFRSYTLLLWLGPAFFIIMGSIAWYFALRRRSSLQISQQVSASSLEQAANLLNNPNHLK